MSQVRQITLFLLSLSVVAPALAQDFELRANDTELRQTLGEKLGIPVEHRKKSTEQPVKHTAIRLDARIRKQNNDLGTAFRVTITVELDAIAPNGETLSRRRLRGNAKAGSEAKAHRRALKQALSSLPETYLNDLLSQWIQTQSVVNLELGQVPPERKDFFELALRKALLKAKVQVLTFRYERSQRRFVVIGRAQEAIDKCQRTLDDEFDRLSKYVRCVSREGLKSRWSAIDQFQPILVSILDFDYKKLDREITTPLIQAFKALSAVRSATVSVDERRTVNTAQGDLSAAFALVVESSQDLLEFDQQLCRSTDSLLRKLELVSLNNAAKPTLCYRWVARARTFEVEVRSIPNPEMTSKLQLLDKTLLGLESISKLERKDDIAAGRVVYQLNGHGSREQLQIAILKACDAHGLALDMAALSPNTGFAGPRLAFQYANTPKRWKIQINDLGSDLFAKIGSEFITTIDSWAGVEIVNRSYQETLQQLTLDLALADGVVGLDQKIWECAWNIKGFGQLVIATSSGQTLAFKVRKKVSNLLAMSLHVDNLRPLAFEEEGQQVVQLLKTIEGLTKISRKYDRLARRMTVNFKTALSPANVDEAIWKALRQGQFARTFAPDRPNGTNLRLIFLEKRGEHHLLLVELNSLKTKASREAAKKVVELINTLTDLRGAPVVRWAEQTANVRLWTKQRPLQLHAFLTNQIAEGLFYEPLEVSSRISGNLIRIRPKATPRKDPTPDRPETPQGPKPEPQPNPLSPNGKSLATLVASLAKKTVHITVQTATRGGTGTGFLVNSRGYILTNYHVVSGKSVFDPADARITVRLHGGQRFRARYLGGSSERDLALIKIAGTGFDYVTIANSDQVRPGEEVVIIGHPYGLDYTVTTGIISALNRFQQRWMQTDAAINPGNSGGPVFDRQGRVIAVSVAGLKKGSNLNFVIPINQAQEFLSQAGVK